MPTEKDLWQQQLEKELRGRPKESTDWRTPDGRVLEAASFVEDVKDLPHLRANAVLRTRGFATRALIADANPEIAAKRARRAFELGADEVEFVFDALAQDAREPSPEAAESAEDDADLGGWSGPGQGGVAVASRADFEPLFRSSPDAHRPLYFAAGDGSLAPLLWTAGSAKAEGLDPSELKVGFDFDPIARLTMRRLMVTEDRSAVICPHTSIDSVFDELAAVLKFAEEALPKARCLVIDGQTTHLVGGHQAFEIATVLCSLIETVRHLSPRAVSIDSILRSSSVRMQVDHEVLTQVAKLRALRLLWAKVVTHLGGSGEDLRPQLVGLTSARARAERFDQRSNLVRSSLASTAAVLGGCDVLVSMPFLDDNSEHAFELALGQQNLLRHESKLDRVADPTGGSYTIESLTDGLARRAWSLVQEIEKRGGLLAVMQEGWLNETLLAQETQREQAVDSGKRVLVGINRFADQELGGAIPTANDEDDQSFILTRVKAFTAFTDGRSGFDLSTERSSPPSASSLRQLAESDQSTAATLSELATLYWPESEVQFGHRFLPIAVADGARFEDLREAALDSEPRPRALLVRFDTDQKLRAICDRGADWMTMVGIDVVETAAFADERAITQTVAEVHPDVVLLAGDPAELAKICDALERVRHKPRALRLALGPIPAALEPRIDAPLQEGENLVEVLGSVLQALGVVLDEDDDSE
ncbi:MAG: methylmalonyl-CoA mutase family protein [Planctomycetota bacterium]